MKRPITREELKEMGLKSDQIEDILKKQRQKKQRRYKYMVLLTTSEAEQLAKKTGKEFVRATEWKNRRKEVK